jgi:hypothetical protein
MRHFFTMVRPRLENVTIALDTRIRSDTVRTIPGSLFTHLEGVYLWLLCIYIHHFPLAEY